MKTLERNLTSAQTNQMVQCMKWRNLTGQSQAIYQQMTTGRPVAMETTGDYAIMPKWPEIAQKRPNWGKLGKTGVAKRMVNMAINHFTFKMCKFPYSNPPDKTNDKNMSPPSPTTHAGERRGGVRMKPCVGPREVLLTKAIISLP